MTKLDSQIEDLQKAVARLEDALKQEKTEYMRDSAIKRFEIVFDLAWKALKEFLEEDRGVLCKSPKECIREGFSQSILDYEDFWMKITDDRNYTVHIYKEALAEKVYADLPQALKCFQQLLEGVKNKKVVFKSNSF